LDDIKNITLKANASSSVMRENGWAMRLYIDDLDVYETSADDDIHEYAFENEANQDLTKKLAKSFSTADTFSFEYKLVTPATTPANSSVKFMVFNEHDWNNYVELIAFNPYTNTTSTSGVTITAIEGGWYKITVDLDATIYTGDKNIIDNAELNQMYIRGAYTNAVIKIDNITIE
ncbi:MAG: hypothetical protein MJ193_05200, partial [Clostridia bacterium]|nr:hypothetical protein [Clostridia bacterium]